MHNQTDKHKIEVYVSDVEMDRIYRQKQRHYWNVDFVNRCMERLQDGNGLCNLPYHTLTDNEGFLNHAYEYFCAKEDCNAAYNDVLDMTIDEMERLIANGDFHVPSSQEDTYKKIYVLCSYGEGLNDPLVFPDYESAYSSMEQSYQLALDGIPQTEDEKEDTYIAGFSARAVIHGNWCEWSITEHSLQ